MKAFSATPFPRLRPLEAIPFESEGERRVAWRDPLGLAPMVEVPHAVALLMSLYDGTRDHAAVADAWRQLAGEDLELDFLTQFSSELDGYLMLDGPRFRTARDEAIAAFRSAGVRPLVHSPGGYPDDPAACAAYFDAMLAGGRAKSPAAGTGPVRGLVAPHIDFHRGHRCYGAAYAALDDCSADLFVVLGIAHSTSCWPLDPPLATLTRVGYDTPFGPAPTAPAFIDALVEGYAAGGGDPDELFVDELVHQREHSIEFQVSFLQHLRPGVPVVPILCGSLHDFYDDPAAVVGRDGLGPLLAGLRLAIERHPGEVCLVAGADLSHVGPRFGDLEPVSQERVREVARADEDALRRFLAAGPESFFEHFSADANARNVCSVSNLYVLRALLAEASAELLRYEAAFDPDQTVTFAAAALR